MSEENKPDHIHLDSGDTIITVRMKATDYQTMLDIVHTYQLGKIIAAKVILTALFGSIVAGITYALTSWLKTLSIGVIVGLSIYLINQFI